MSLDAVDVSVSESPPQSASPATAQPVPQRKQRKTRRRASERTWGLWFIAPAGAFFLFAFLWPSIQGVVYSFTDWYGRSTGWEWVGIANYQRLLSDPLLLATFGHTLLITVVLMGGANAIGLGLALLLNQPLKSRAFLRMVFFLPVVLTPVVVANIWKFILLPDGALNTFLATIGISGSAWLGDPTTALVAVIVTMVWQITGLCMVLYLAGLQNIPEDIIEAAHLDGAGAWGRFVHVTLPSLTPAVTVSVLLTGLIGLKAFDQPWILTGGGPGNATQTLSTAQYQVTFQFGDFAYGSTFSVLIALLTLIAALLQQVALRKKKNADA